MTEQEARKLYDDFQRAKKAWEEAQKFLKELDEFPSGLFCWQERTNREFNEEAASKYLGSDFLDLEEFCSEKVYNLKKLDAWALLRDKNIENCFNYTTSRALTAVKK